MASKLVSFALAALIAICLFEIAKSEGNRKHQTFRAKVYTEKVVAHKRKNSPVKRGGGSSSKTRSTKKSRDGRVRSISTSHSSIFFYERTKNIKKATAKKAGMEKEVVQKKANAKNAAKKPVAKEPEPEGDGEAKTMANNNGKVRQKVCLIVIDGWGLAYEKKGNAIANAKTPVMDELCFGNWQQLEAHGLHVGLEPELMGNSEVGHLNIGAGRVVYQDIVRINLAVQKNKLVSNEQVIAAAERAKKGNGRLHLLGLVSDGGVHSHIEHLFGLIRAFKQLQVPHLYIHFFGDGRDTSPTSGVGYLKQLLDFITAQKYGELGTIIGRYYAMDRDKRWERIKIAYEALIGGIVPEGGEKTTVDRAIEAVKARYEQNPSETDEFLKPIVFSDEARVNDNDTLVFFNYRADRMRQINECMGLEKYKDLQSSVPHPQNIQLFGMTQYNKEFPFPILFPPVSHKNVLAEWLSSQGVSQFHCAETEKYAHVTFFFNGGREVQFEGEERSMVPSPKVPTYDLQPEMSASGVADKMVEQIQLGKHPFVMCNFAPPDMVGHTGQYEPAVKACEATDQAIGRIYEACKKHGYVLMVTADHGNAEKMVAVDGGKHTAHTCNLVPFTCSSQQFVFKKDPPIGEDGQPRARALRDVAPSVLFLLGLPTPPEMDGVNLLEEYK